MNGVIYPGTFDPITNGHVDIVKRSSAAFGRVLVAVGMNPNKETLFSMEERIQLVKGATEHLEGVEVEGFQGLLVPFALEKGIRLVVKGMRFVSDFEQEFQMALINQKLDPRVETVFMVSREAYTYLSSSVIRQIFTLGGDVSTLVPRNVEAALGRKLRSGAKA